MRLGLIFAGLIVVAGLAGCLGTFEEPPEQDEDDGDSLDEEALLAQMTEQGDQHNHSDRQHHDVAFQTELLDHEVFSEEGDAQTTALAYVAEEDLLFVDGNRDGLSGFFVLDVSEPSNMTVLGSYLDDQLVGGDRGIAASEDGQWVVVGTEGAVEEEESGVWLFDVSDPSAPEPVAMSPLEGGAHTVDTILIDGTRYVFALNAGVEILRVVESPTGTELVKVSKYTVATEQMLENPYADSDPSGAQSWTYRAAWAHDMWPVVDPEEGPLLYVAYAYQGLHVLDIENPEAPQLVSTWAPEDEHAPWYVHGVDVGHIDDRRVIVVGSEVFEKRHHEVPSPLWVLDGTNLEDPELLSTWTNPADAGSQNIRFSLHFYRLDDGYVHLSHYHGGVWTLDMTTQEAQEDPQVVGAYLPSEDVGVAPEPGGGFNLAGIPTTMDAVGAGSVTFAADLHTGVYAIENAAIEQT